MNNNTLTQQALSKRVVLGLGLLVLQSPLSVYGHGYVDSPKARQAVCQAQGGYWWPQTGENIPNLACRAAYLATGYVQFVQEHEFAVNISDYQNQAAVEAHVPDGLLCSAGSEEKGGMNLPSSHWHVSEVVPDEQDNIQLRFRATTPHNPSFWQFYLTRQGFQVESQEITWADLEPVQAYDDVDVIKDSDGKSYYEMAINIPAERSGRAVLYTRWQRYDVAGEGFYNCSDIDIKRDTSPENWQPIGYFIRQGQEGGVGESARARLFDAGGQELINRTFAITQANVNQWQQSFATELAADLPRELQIGVKDAAGNITFDANNPLSNQVWVTNANYSFTLSLAATPINTPPVIDKLLDQEADENTSLQVTAVASDGEQSQLSYHWQVPAPLSYVGDGAGITITTPEVEQSTDFSLAVTVSDGELSASESFNLKVNNIPEPEIPLWSAEQVYVGDDLVRYQGQVYRAKWWTLNEIPGRADVWEKH
ncbi:lytic polysaccharide monooxygenase [Thalassomonas haliotis]|uniref:Lytic polysaccharide monooxygenase n=1 Tax=Thalassomonas haliotis TaxID=485448 RepID=A0ABY7VAA3_9GAMM|nr:lytic polysaccharide monooxygenase [Thalassomonas haliotis]WDE10165.1 lytic polysaccharide monooxygenase [Thalassomonas haliotis]